MNKADVFSFEKLYHLNEMFVRRGLTVFQERMAGKELRHKPCELSDYGEGCVIIKFFYRYSGHDYVSPEKYEFVVNDIDEGITDIVFCQGIKAEQYLLNFFNGIHGFRFSDFMNMIRR